MIWANHHSQQHGSFKGEGYTALLRHARLSMALLTDAEFIVFYHLI
ncbi:hypothetical protein RINTU1_21620 [Candidatus Regiella insecticola]|uniref:Uncharacterized protein n=1 Tax=Candidatus Regiella insecticola TaxID=138073 RepID=A0A6L2ZQJ6_9ENTR|nr:hypothetical protein RINTU1_21620 [Candidatus Regiella insecticola]